MDLIEILLVNKLQKISKQITNNIIFFNRKIQDVVF